MVIEFENHSYTFHIIGVDIDNYISFTVTQISDGFDFEVNGSGECWEWMSNQIDIDAFNSYVQHCYEMGEL